MNVEEKRDKVGEYCDHISCEICKLKVEGWEMPTLSGCLHITNSPESDLDKALALIGVEIENDPVNHPSHYTDGKIEVIDFIEDKKLGFCLGNAVKYIARAGKKDPTKEIEDLKKAKWYVERRIKELEEVK